MDQKIDPDYYDRRAADARYMAGLADEQGWSAWARALRAKAGQIDINAAARRADSPVVHYYARLSIEAPGWTVESALAHRAGPGAPVWMSAGIGLNFAAMVARMVERGDRIDGLQFADTGGERPETYEALEWWSRWLIDHGYPPIVVVQYLIYGVDDLEGACLRNETYPSLAFGRRGCSIKHKHQPMEHFRKAQNTGSEKPLILIGYDAGEGYRRSNITENDFFKYCYPLIEWEWAREECRRYLLRRGLPVPGPSACYYCPAASRYDLEDLRAKHPTLALRTIAIEEGGHKTGAGHGLGGQGRWLKPILTGKQIGLFPARRDEMPCGCYTGERDLG